MDQQVLSLVLSRMDNRVLDALSRSSLAKVINSLRDPVLLTEEFKKAVRVGDIDGVKRLLSEVECPSDAVEKAVHTAVNLDKTAILDLLLRSGCVTITSALPQTLLYEAILSKASNVVSYLLRRRDVNPNRAGGYALTTAISLGDREVVQAMLEDKRIAISDAVLEQVAQTNDISILSSVVLDPRVKVATTSVKSNLLDAAIRLGDEDVVAKLADGRIVANEQQFSNAIIGGKLSIVKTLLLSAKPGTYTVPIQYNLDRARSLRMSSDMIDFLIREKGVDLEAIPDDQMQYIVRELDEDKYISDSVAGCVRFSNDPGSYGAVIEALSRRGESLYGRLLREVVIKRADYIYYLDWLIAESSMLVGRAAAAVLTEKPVAQESSLFTAFEGFLLYGTWRWTPPGQIARGVIDALLTEPGVTSEGLKLAQTLLGALVGDRKLGVNDESS